MGENIRLTQIRESERKSHIEMYSNEELYQEGSWLRKPIKTVLDLLPLFSHCKELNALDLGCGVGTAINGIVSPIEDYVIRPDYYDLIIAISALEHIDSEESFVKKMEEIRQGIGANGVVCLVINSEVQEKDKMTGADLPAQFEVNLPTRELQEILEKVFEGWEVMKSAVQAQHYDIPRDDRTVDLKTNVVTFVARKRCIG